MAGVLAHRRLCVHHVPVGTLQLGCRVFRRVELRFADWVAV